MKYILGLVALGGALALAPGGPAWAHTELVGSSPAANATLTASPRNLTLTFSERVIPTFSKLELTMPGHGMKIPVTTTFSSDGKRMIATPRSPLMKGAYEIEWTTGSADGHKVTGKVAFRVG